MCREQYDYLEHVALVVRMGMGSTAALLMPLLVGWLVSIAFALFVAWLWAPASRAEMLPPLPPGASPSPPVEGRLTIVMPTFNEEANIRRTIRLLASKATRPSNIELIVVDAGSEDLTVELTREEADNQGLLLRQLQIKGGGRGAALAEGALLASGESIMFLHADCVPPDDFDEQALAALDSGALLVSFTLGFDYDASPSARNMPKLDFVGWFVALRTEKLQFPYGDQGLTMRLSSYRALGGFQKLPLMEDFDFVRRVRRASADGAGDIVKLKAEILSNPRRWEKYGCMGVTLRNNFLVAVYRIFRLTPTQIYRLYYGSWPKQQEG
jgi:glycosyltransferase involved in cell wall biosynthesis